MKRALAGLMSSAFFLFQGTQALAVTVQFDELPFQAVDGLTFAGVTYDFKVGGLDSIDASFNSGGPGALTYVQDPSLEGDANGILTLDFATPTLDLAFGVALNTGANLSPGFQVSLFDPALALIATLPVPTQNLLGAFTEGQFSISGTPISRAVLDFNHTSRFALDNLTYNPVPLPAAIWLLGSALLGIFGFARKQNEAVTA